MKNALVVAGLVLGGIGCDSPEVKAAKEKLQQAEGNIHSALIATLDADKAGKCKKLDPYQKYENLKLKCPTNENGVISFRGHTYTEGYSDPSRCYDQKYQEELRQGDREQDRHRAKIRCDIGNGVERTVYLSWESFESYVKEDLVLVDIDTGGGHSSRANIEIQSKEERGEFTYLYLDPSLDKHVHCVPSKVSPFDPSPVLSYMCNTGGESSVDLSSEYVIEVRDRLRGVLSPLKGMEREFK